MVNDVRSGPSIPISGQLRSTAVPIPNRYDANWILLKPSKSITTHCDFLPHPGSRRLRRAYHGASSYTSCCSHPYVIRRLGMARVSMKDLEMVSGDLVWHYRWRCTWIASVSLFCQQRSIHLISDHHSRKLMRSKTTHWYRRRIWGVHRTDRITDDKILCHTLQPSLSKIVVRRWLTLFSQMARVECPCGTSSTYSPKVDFWRCSSAMRLGKNV